MSLVTESGLVVKLVLLMLVGASVFCWAIIFTKWRSLQRALDQNTQFLNLFWHSKSLEELSEKTERFSSSPVAAVFQAGLREYSKVAPGGVPAGAEHMENVFRALVRSSNSEVASLERHISWLATTASAAPFIGLFGTVWGIMNSFQSIGVTGAANLAVVAPGISEALIATATGLAAAIPAVVAYNHFVGQIKRLAVDMDCFTHDLLNIIQRSQFSARKGN
ncbi:MAG: protein TolQ [Bdellovibrionales bacterium GWB1_55_8]|nr:MAG: protein TolQ [Bdellovibrionales bacterium GWB1_55_8]